MMMNTFRWFCLGMAVILMSVAAYGEERTSSTDKEIHVNPEVPRITAYEAKKLFSQGKLILVNTQEEAGIEKTMLIGAIAAPEGLINGQEIEVPRETILAFYCV